MPGGRGHPAECSRCRKVRVIVGRTLCNPCYQGRWRRGEPMPARTTMPFEDNMALAAEGRGVDDCWPWPALLSDQGYPPSRVYRRAWSEAAGQPVPDGLEIDHACHSTSPDCAGGPTCPHRACVNPAHLRPATRAENSSVGWRRPRPMVCQAGLHELAPDRKGCVSCRDEYQAKYRQARRKELAAAQRARYAARRREEGAAS